MKFKVVSNYDIDLNMYNSVMNCFPNKTSLVLTAEDDYDYLLVVNGYQSKLPTFMRQQIKVKRERVIGTLQEPVGNSSYDRNLHFYCKTIFCQSRSMFNNFKGIKECFLPMFYRHHETTHRDYFLNYNEIGQRKKLCLIVSAVAHPNNPQWHNHNYTKRIKMVEKLLKSDLDFDFYGWGWDKWWSHKLGGLINDSRYKGPCKNKHETLRKYEYSIAMENVCEKNYASEKLLDCILNNTVPLYYGCPNYDEVLDKNSVIPIDITQDVVIEEIKNIIAEDSHPRLLNLLESKQNYFDKMNMFNIVEEIV